MCGCLSCVPHWGPGLQPRHVLWLGIEPVTLWFTGLHSDHWATPARCVQVFIWLCFHFSWVYLRVKWLIYMVGMFNFIRNFQIIILLYILISTVVHLCQYLVWSVFYILVILVEVYWYLTVVLVCIFLLMILSIFLHAYLASIYLFQRSKSFAHLNWVVCLIIELQEFFMYSR